MTFKSTRKAVIRPLSIITFCSLTHAPLMLRTVSAAFAIPWLCVHFHEADQLLAGPAARKIGIW